MKAVMRSMGPRKDNALLHVIAKYSKKKKQSSVFGDNSLAILMETSLMCSKDQSNPAVCCCICEFPLLSLCEKHLDEHPTDSEAFFHFHLPLNASQIITTSEIKAKYDTWFYKLHRAGTLLKANNEELKQFEDQIEAAKQEIFNDLETEFEQAKQIVANLREAFNVKLQTAIKDTRAHAMEEWIPEPGSLSSLIWNFDTNNPSSLKLFGLWAGKQSSAHVLQIYISSSIPSLAQFNQSIDQTKEQILQQTQLELVESSQRNEELKAEIAKLREEIQNLQDKCDHLSETIESLKGSTEIHINRVKKEKEKIQLDCKAEVKILKLELAKSKKANEGEVKTLNEEIDALKSVCKEIQLIKEQREAIFLYEQRAASFRERWNSIRNKVEVHEQTANVGLALSTDLGMRLCQFAEAESVIDESLRVVTARIPTSAQEMRLRNRKATVYFHNNKNADCEAICVETLQRFERAKLDAEFYWVTLFYLTFALCEQCKYIEANTVLKNWSAKSLLRDNYFLRPFLEFHVRGRKERANNEKKAEDSFKKAAQVVAQQHSTSIYAAINLLELGIYYINENQMDEATVTLLKANRIFSVQFPCSFYSALTLTWIAAVFEKSGKFEEACSKCIEAHNILALNYPSNRKTTINLSHIALLYYNMDRIVEAEQTLLQVHYIYEDYCPTSDTAAINLYNFAILYEKIKRIEQALVCATSASDIWNRSKSENAQKLALPLLERLKRPKK